MIKIFKLYFEICFKYFEKIKEYIYASMLKADLEISCSIMVFNANHILY